MKQKEPGLLESALVLALILPTYAVFWTYGAYLNIRGRIRGD